MDALRAAAPLARVLLSTADPTRTGVLRVRALGRVALVWLDRGDVVHLDGVGGPLLGDALLEEGALDLARHREAMTAAPPDGPVGQWLADRGVVERSAIERALRQQLVQRAATMLCWPSPTFSFTSALRRSGDALVRVALGRLVWEAMGKLAARLSSEELRALGGSGRLRLTVLGRRLARSYPELTQQARWLEACSEAAPERAALCALGAVVTAGGPDAYSLLLRKRRQIARQAAPAALLDLPATSRPEQAKQALRRLAGRLHPDRFQGAEPELRALSGEVLRALVHAEQALRSAR